MTSQGQVFQNTKTKSISCSSPPLMTSQVQVNKPRPLPPNQHRAPTHAPPPMHGAASPSTKCTDRPHLTCRHPSYTILLLYFQCFTWTPSQLSFFIVTHLCQESSLGLIRQISPKRDIIESNFLTLKKLEKPRFEPTPLGTCSECAQ